MKSHEGPFGPAYLFFNERLIVEIPRSRRPWRFWCACRRSQGTPDSCLTVCTPLVTFTVFWHPPAEVASEP